MPLTEHDHYLIEQHLFDRLSAADKITFEQRQADSEFHAELLAQQDIFKALYSSGRDALKTELQSFEANISNTSVRKTRTMPRWWTMAAAILVLVVALFWIFQPSTSTSELFAQYFEPYPNVVAPIQKGDQENNSQKLAYQAYERKNYDEAIGYFENISPSSDTSNFYLGLCYLGKRDFKAAIASLGKIDEASSFYDPAKWYLALTYLKVGKIEQSKFLLRTIQKGSSSPFKTKAEDLLSKIE